MVLADTSGGYAYAARYKDYRAFGQMEDEEISLNLKYKYTGKPFDDEQMIEKMYYYGARYYLPGIKRWKSVDPKLGKYPSTSPYVYSLNNPLKYRDPDGRKVTKFKINVETARAKIYSDVNPTKDVPVAVTDFNSYSGPTAGTTLYVKSTAWGPTSNLWENAQTSWQQNKNNPFGPAIILLKDKKGNMSSEHLHGTNGPLEGGVEYIGGSKAKNRKFTHGCTRFTNQTITDIMKEGVEEGAPVEFVDDEEDENKDDSEDENNAERQDQDQ